MSEFKGSIGPWEHYGPSGYQHSMGGYVESGDGKVCDVSGFDVGSDKAKANARLIAAAPELLEALQKLISDYDRYKSATLIEKTELETLPLKAARAAIAKALGQ
ncbi:hypothetical protein [Pantoea ananatis]|uniref:hypothetical protein n=1 Tax=Pantoea ananas TaxID=553 RepID=UPI001B30953C|nr:hypothetical protein [Pantoea ananatis]